MKIEVENQPNPDWKKIIEEQEKSGLSQSTYCKQHGIDLAKFGYHRGRIKTKQQLNDSNNTEFKPVKITAQVNTVDEIKITLPNGFQCIFSNRTDAMQIKKIIEILLSC